MPLRSKKEGTKVLQTVEDIEPGTYVSKIKADIENRPYLSEHTIEWTTALDEREEAINIYPYTVLFTCIKDSVLNYKAFVFISLDEQVWIDIFDYYNSSEDQITIYQIYKEGKPIKFGLSDLGPLTD